MTTDRQRQFTVGLSGLRCFSYHGLFEQEQRIGNEFAVDLSVTYTPERKVGDDISSTISYADLHDIVIRRMKQPRLLLETVAEEIADEILTMWPFVNCGCIRITKLTPPIAGITGSAFVEYKF